CLATRAPARGRWPPERPPARDAARTGVGGRARARGPRARSVLRAPRRRPSRDSVRRSDGIASGGTVAMAILRPETRRRAPDGADSASSDTSQGLLERTHGPKQMQLHGSRRQTEHVGGLLGGPALDLPEEEDLLLAT